MTITALRIPEVRTYRFVAPNTPDAARLAREHVAVLLAHTRCRVAVDVAQLLVSEVVANAYRHTAAATVALTTTVQPSRVHVEVYDNDPTPLPPRAVRDSAAGLLAECGRGLLMLQLLASRWDWEPCGGDEPCGKAVWFELCALAGAR